MRNSNTLRVSRRLSNFYGRNRIRHCPCKRSLQAEIHCAWWTTDSCTRGGKKREFRSKRYTHHESARVTMLHWCRATFLSEFSSVLLCRILRIFSAMNSAHCGSIMPDRLAPIYMINNVFLHCFCILLGIFSAGLQLSNFIFNFKSGSIYSLDFANKKHHFVD